MNERMIKMKKRWISMLLALILLLGAVATPVYAVTAKDVHTYLKELAMDGSYDSSGKYWYNGFKIGSNDAGDMIFWVQYMESTKYVHMTIENRPTASGYLGYEVTWKISSNPSPSYNAYIELYDGNTSAEDTKGVVVLPANYSGGDYTAFKTFTGNTNYKAAMLEVLNGMLPGVVEYTRAIINEKDYTLANLGMTGYKKCDWVHAYDHGKVTTQPTCGASGVRTYTCRVCGEKYTETIDPTGNHTWDKGTVTVEPTCTVQGVRRYSCTVCHTTKEESIPATGHKWDTGVEDPSPTCTEAGSIKYTCQNCSATRSEEIPALGHLWTYTETLRPTTDEEHGTARYTCTRCNETKEDLLCASVIFTDMPAEGNWAHNPIDWAYFNGITTGKTATTFGPKATCNRAQVVTFLWSMAGKPEPETTENPFTDVKDSAYYYKPVLWAVEQGITSGKTATTFGPKANCTRAQVVTFLYKAEALQAVEAPQ